MHLYELPIHYRYYGRPRVSLYLVRGAIAYGVFEKVDFGEKVEDENRLVLVDYRDVYVLAVDFE